MSKRCHSPRLVWLDARCQCARAPSAQSHGHWLHYGRMHADSIVISMIGIQSTEQFENDPSPPLSVCLSISVRLSVSMSVSVCLSVRLSVCLSLSSPLPPPPLISAMLSKRVLRKCCLPNPLRSTTYVFRLLLLLLLLVAFAFFCLFVVGFFLLNCFLFWRHAIARFNI